MPEGDTIFRAAQTLSLALTGKAITRFEAAYAHLRAANVDRPVVGRVMQKVHALGKHLLMELSGDLILRTHMRMSGSWHIYRPGERWQRPARAMSVLLETQDFVAVGFDVPVAEFHTAASLARSPEMRRLGPDLLAPDFALEPVLRALANRPQEIIADALLDQSLAAGAGNVFKCEALFLEGVHPATPVARVSDETRERLLRLTQKLMLLNVNERATRGPAHRLRNTTGRSDPAERLWVYGRAGKPCRRCGTAIAVQHLGKHARITYHCPHCQPEASPQPEA